MRKTTYKSIVMIIAVLSLLSLAGCNTDTGADTNAPDGSGDNSGQGDASTGDTDRHYCTEEEKQAEFCTMEYAPVCGDNGKTYGNGCSACASGEIDYYVPDECPE